MNDLPKDSEIAAAVQRWNDLHQPLMMGRSAGEKLKDEIAALQELQRLKFVGHLKNVQFDVESAITERKNKLAHYLGALI